jgi:hypothetical protein
MATANLQLEQQKKLERASRFGIEIPELEIAKKKQRAERFGIETKESLEAKRIQRMRKFGLDVKNNEKSGDSTVRTNTGADDLDAVKAARIKRFGEVDPQDLK